MSASVQTNTVTNNTIWTLSQNEEENKEYAHLKSRIEKVVNSCQQLLYDNGSIVGTKAQNDIMRLLCVHILKDQFADERAELWNVCNQVKIKKNLTDAKFAKYKSFCKEPTELNTKQEFFKEWRFFVRDLLRDALPGIFSEEDERFNCTNYHIVIQMIVKMHKELPDSSQFRDAFSTSCGDIHEMFRAYGGGQVAKELGQFFTPRELIHLIFHGMQFSTLIPERTDVSIYDPCMGTGGFLTRMHNMFSVQAEHIYGCETEADTLKFGQMSMILTSGKVCNNLTKCNSISENPFIAEGKQFDVIVTNPPFGTSMKYDDLKKTFDLYLETKFPDAVVKFKDVYPIKTNKGTCLFVQHCVHILKPGGVCVIVLPDGEMFDSHSKWSAKFRKWWCESVNIRTILKVPPGVFKHAGVRTNVVVFTKDGPTTSIRFQDIPDKSCERINELFSVDMNDIVHTGYNLDPKAYTKDDSDTYDVPMVALGEVCTFEKGRTLKKSDFETSGSIPVIGGGRQPTGMHTHSNRTANTILFSSSGSYAGYISRYETPVWASDCFSIQPNDCLLNQEYLYFVLLHNQQRIYDIRPPSAGQPHLYAHNLEPFKIPLPPLAIQHQIVHELQTIETNIQTIRTRMLQLKQEKSMFHKYGRKSELLALWKGCEWVKLGDVCTFEKGSLQSTKNVEGDYPFITAADEDKSHNAFIHDKECVLFVNGSEGSLAKVKFWSGGKFTASSLLLILTRKQENILHKYISLLLQKQKESICSKYAKGSSKRTINKDDLRNFKIPLPSLAIQQQSITIFEEKNNHIQLLDECIQREAQHVEDLKQLGKDVISSFCGGGGSSSPSTAPDSVSAVAIIHDVPSTAPDSVGSPVKRMKLTPDPQSQMMS